MPTVPYDPQIKVPLRIEPTPYDRTVVPFGAFGDYTARATQNLGATLSQVGGDLLSRALALQTLDQQAAADDAISNFQMRSAIQHNEMLNRTGKEAADSLIPTLRGIEQTRDSIRQSLSSSYAQTVYDRATRGIQGHMMNSASSHAAREHKAYVTGSLQARSDAADNTALTLSQEDNAAFEASLAEKDKIADQMAEQGVFRGGKAERDLWVARAKSTLTLNRVTSIARTGDPFTAERVANKAIADGNLSGQDIAVAISRIQAKRDTVGAATEADRILSGEGSFAGGDSIPIDQAATTVGQFISKGDYDWIGRTQDGSDQALGKYGVPAEQLGTWLKEADMPDMIVADFLKSHQAQDKLFTTRFGKFQSETGNFNDAWMKWIGKKPVTMEGIGTSAQRQAFGVLKSLGWHDDWAHGMIATLSGESGQHLNTKANQTAGDGGRDWGRRFQTSGAGNGVANWDNARAQELEGWAKAHGMDVGSLETQIRFVDFEVRRMGFDPTKSGNPRDITIHLTGSTASGQGFERPRVNNGAERWARYSGQRYAHDSGVQQVNGILARNTPIEVLVERGRTRAAYLAPNNPIFADALSNRLLGMRRHQLAEQRLEEFENKQKIEAGLNPDEQGRVPTSLEELRQLNPEAAEAYEHASQPEQRRVQSALAKNALAGGVELTSETARQFVHLHNAAIDPGATQQQRQELLDTTVSDLNMPMKYRQQLFADQQKVYKREEASPQMGRALRVLGPTLTAIDLTKSSRPDNYALFLSELHDAIQEYHRTFARPMSDDDIKEIGARLLQPQPQGFIASWFTDPTRWYELPVPPEFADIARADPRWERDGVDPTDAMIREMWVKQQFQQLYSRKRLKK